MKGVKKHNLPQKICKTCGKPFGLRKKWEKVWQEVKYCSDKCNFGTGVTCRLVSPELTALHRRLSALFAAHLILQDRQGFRP